MKKEKPSFEELYDLYVNQEFSQRDIAKKYSVSQTTVRRWMKSYNIESRTSEEGRKTKKCQEKMAILAERYKTEYLKSHELQCQYCGKTFVVYGSDKKDQKYCFSECRKAAVFGPLEPQYCQNCGKEIENTREERSSRKYCEECVKKRPWAKKDRVKTKCAYCQKTLYVIKSRFESRKNCYCDRECMANYYSIHYTGENSPTWRGGKPDHYTGRFDKQRLLARERDNYTCQLCGITEEEYGKQMSVHHIDLYRNYEDKIEANRLENLICLCEPCHRFVHSNSNKEKKFLK